MFIVLIDDNLPFSVHSFLLKTMLFLRAVLTEQVIAASYLLVAYFCDMGFSVPCCHKLINRYLRDKIDGDLYRKTVTEIHYLFHHSIVPMPRK